MFVVGGTRTHNPSAKYSATIKLWQNRQKRDYDLLSFINYIGTYYKWKKSWSSPLNIKTKKFTNLPKLMIIKHGSRLNFKSGMSIPALRNRSLTSLCDFSKTIFCSKAIKHFLLKPINNTMKALRAGSNCSRVVSCNIMWQIIKRSYLKLFKLRVKTRCMLLYSSFSFIYVCHLTDYHASVK